MVIGARTAERGEAARAEITADAAPGVSVSVLPLDVADQASIRSFAAAVCTRHDTLDVLVNNAGASFGDRRLGPDGYELTFATNVLGPYLLTELLLDPLRGADAARVVNIASSIAGNYDPTDLQFSRRRYSGLKAYSQSKQALMMLTWGLATRLADSSVSANAAGPGFVRTQLNRNTRGLMAVYAGLAMRLLAVAPTKGADTPLWVATAPELDGVSGKLFMDRKEQPLKFDEPDAIANLERQCQQMVQVSAG